MRDDDIWNRVPVLIQTGMQKSGTSWLTEKYFRHFPDRFALHADSKVLNALLLTCNERKFSPEKVREELRFVAEDAEKHGKIVVIIGVFISGMPTDHYAVLPSNLRRTLAAFPKAKLLVTLREQTSIMMSVFSELVRGGLTASFRDFLCQPPADVPFSGIIDFDFYDYNYMYDIYTDSVSRDDLVFMPQEWILKEPDKAIAHMAQHFGWEWPVPEAASINEKVRPSLSWPALSLTRQGNRLITPGLRWQRAPLIRPTSVAHWADKLTPQSVNSWFVKKNRAYVKDVVGDYFMAANRTASSKIGIDLGQFGYF